MNKPLNGKVASAVKIKQASVASWVVANLILVSIKANDYRRFVSYWYIKTEKIEFDIQYLILLVFIYSFEEQVDCTSGNHEKFECTAQLLKETGFKSFPHIN